MIFSFVLANLIVAVVVANMEQAIKEDEKRIRLEMQRKLIEGTNQLPNQSASANEQNHTGHNIRNTLKFEKIEKISKG